MIVLQNWGASAPMNSQLGPLDRSNVSGGGAVEDLHRATEVGLRWDATSRDDRDFIKPRWST